MGKKILVLAVTVIGIATMIGAPSAFAAGKTAFVDLGTVFDGYEKTKDYDAVLESDQKQKQGQIDAKVEEIKSLQEKISLLSDKEKEKKQKEMEEKTESLKEFQRNSETELLKTRDERLKEILEDIQKVVEETAKKDGYDLIFNERVLLYGADSMDITESILKQLNDSYKK